MLGVRQEHLRLRPGLERLLDVSNHADDLDGRVVGRRFGPQLHALAHGVDAWEELPRQDLLITTILGAFRCRASSIRPRARRQAPTDTLASAR